MTLQNHELIIPYIHDALKRIRWVSNKENYPTYVKPENGKAIRLDISASIESFDGYPVPIKDDGLLRLTPHLLDLIVRSIAPDIADIVVNGDVNSTDPLLKTFDGEVKTGQRFKAVNFSPVMYCQEYVKPKDIWEFTIYLVIGVE